MMRPKSTGRRWRGFEGDGGAVPPSLSPRSLWDQGECGSTPGAWGLGQRRVGTGMGPALQAASWGRAWRGSKDLHPHFPGRQGVWLLLSSAGRASHRQLQEVAGLVWLRSTNSGPWRCKTIPSPPARGIRAQQGSQGPVASKLAFSLEGSKNDIRPA